MATDWVVDRGLDVLLAQINAAAPDRSKASDGSIGDPAHQARESDHNPESPPPAGNPDEQVDARDFTHDPAHGADMGVVTEAIRKSRDRRVKYVIFNRRIFSSYATATRKAWEWGPYDGEDPHENHAHVSVNDVHHDETQLWAIGIDMGLTDYEHNAAMYDNNRIEAMSRGFDKVANHGPAAPQAAGEPVWLTITLKGIDRKADDLAKAVVDLEEKVDQLSTDILAELAEVKRLIAAIGTGGGGSVTISGAISGTLSGSFTGTSAPAETTVDS